MQYQHFTIEEREKIQYGLWEKRSVREIARLLGRSPSSVSREIRRNLPQERYRYTPRLAYERAMTKRKSRGRMDRLKNDTIRTYVVDYLKNGWSPEQIAGRIAIDLPGCTISHEAIYQYVYAQIHRQGYGYPKPGCEDLRSYLKRRHKRREKKGMRKGQRVLRPKGPCIDERPAIVDHRVRIGDWESDTITSKDNAPGLNSLVERKIGLVFLTKLSDKTTAATTGAISNRLSSLSPYHLCHTLTLDNGSENQDWQRIEKEIGTKCFFAHPYHSWERGTNENTNGLVRWYFPKGTDFRTITDKEIARVEYALNTRPRKRLGWRTPLEIFNEQLLVLHLGIECTPQTLDKYPIICYT